MLSAVEPGINGPYSRSDHRHGDAEASEYERDQRMTWGTEKYPGLDKRDGNSCDWRPQA